MSIFKRIFGRAEGAHPYWVALEEWKCTGPNYRWLRSFCDERGLSLSRHGHSVAREHKRYQVFMFAEEEHAEIFREAFGGERMHPPEKGKGAR
ncbi:hypothetical protein [Nitrobacter sp. TKz-YC02]|uniref:hypothetical protein n=1 Tax=Nitrobacter sp. TKz-YC02 TaxID=3398704 RepID=UPI003CE7AE16